MAQEHKKFHHFTSADGLSSNSVRCLYQDKKGFIWIGTDGGGLNRFDGYHFTVFNYQDDNPQSISNNQIYTIIEDHNGYLWVATGNGLNRFDPNTGQFKRFYHDPVNPKSLLHNKTTAIFEDSENTIWVGTLMGFQKYNPDSEDFINYSGKMSTEDKRLDMEINTIVDDHHGNLWLGTWWGGLKKFNKKSTLFTDFYCDPAYSNSIRNNNVLSLYIDKQNILWIGNYLGGIRKLNLTTENYIPINDPENDASTMGICCDRSGRIWYSRSGIGIVQSDSYRINSKTFQLLDYNISNPYGINSGIYKSVLCDRTGIIWLGSDQGLSMYDANREKFTPFYQSIINDHFKIEKFYLDREKNILWLGTLKNGLIKYDEKTHKVTHFLSEKSLDNRFLEIQTLNGNSKDQLWIGTNNGIGILDMNTGKIIKTLYNSPNKLTLANRVYGNNEFLWLSNDNIRIIDVRLEKEYEFSSSGTESLPCQQITGVLNDNASNLWIGTFEGLSKYNCITHKIENYFNQLSDSSSISNKYILSLFQDSRKYIWIGTQNGLNRYNVNSDNFERFTHNTTFASNYILDIKEDDHHNLWLFTDKGITKFNPDNGLTRNYDEKDGLDFGSKVFADNNGLFYCNNRTKDYYVFNPDSIKDNPIVPPVYITRFSLFNKEVTVSNKTNKTPLLTNISETHEITLKYSQSYMSFEFVALNYTLPEKNQYAYRMEGFDNNWYYTDALHLSATYTNLNPGSYIFRVKASNNDGIWNEKGAEIKIIILPPFWKTKWAYFVFFIIIAGFIYVFRTYLLYQYKLKTKLEIERIKAEKTHEVDQLKLDFFGNISHEFRTPLTLISGPLDYIFARQTQLNWVDDHKYFSMMKRNVDRLLQMINKVLDIRKLDSGVLNIYLKNDDIVQFVKSLTESFKFKAEQKNIDFNIIFHQTIHDTWFDPDLTDKIVFNLLSNAFKFTPDHGEISIETIILKCGSDNWKRDTEINELNPSSDLVKIIVKDNGIGIPAEQTDKIFDRFYQADNQASRSGGSGIGLALVKELVGLVDGKVKLESVVDEGSCFTIWMPIGQDTNENQSDNSFALHTEPAITSEENHSLMAQDQAEEKLMPPDGMTGNPLILIVEDNLDMQLFVSDILENDFEVVLANNGKTGFELAMEYIPDLIVSDIMMPDMDGLEMCQLIRNNERTNHIPIILLTARSTDEYQNEGLFAGADDYIMKPFNARNLQLRVSNIIKSRQRLREKFSLSAISANPEKGNIYDDAFINKIKIIVENHLSDPDFDPQILAAELVMSRAQLYRKIKAVTNQTVNDFIFSVRINSAARLLITEDLTVSETAYAVGFKSPAHFSKMFSTLIGQSPTKYIELHKKPLV